MQSQSAAMSLITCCVEQIRQNQRWTVVWTACDTGGRWLLLHLVVVIVLPLPVVRRCRWCLHANTLQTVANFLGQHHAHSVCLTWKETSRCLCKVSSAGSDREATTYDTLSVANVPHANAHSFSSEECHNHSIQSVVDGGGMIPHIFKYIAMAWQWQWENHRQHMHSHSHMPIHEKDYRCSRWNVLYVTNRNELSNFPPLSCPPTTHKPLTM